MKLDERKKDIESKLGYIGFNKKDAESLIDLNYNLLSRMVGYSRVWRKRIDESYNHIKVERENRNILNKLEKKGLPQISYS